MITAETSRLAGKSNRASTHVTGRASARQVSDDTIACHVENHTASRTDGFDSTSPILSNDPTCVTSTIAGTIAKTTTNAVGATASHPAAER